MRSPRGSFRFSIRWLAFLVCAWTLAAPLRALADDGIGDWWSTHFQVHGFLRSTAYFRTPNMSQDFHLSSWRQDLQLKADLQLVEEGAFRLSFHGILRPTYDAVYDLYPDTWGSNVDGGRAFPIEAPTSALADASRKGDPFTSPLTGNRLTGACIRGEFCLANSPITTIFSGEPAPSLFIDNVIFFGALPAPVNTRGPQQVDIGGNSDGKDFQKALDLSMTNLGAFTAPQLGLAANAFAVQGLQGDLALASRPLNTPINWYHHIVSGPKSFDQAPFDMNRRLGELAFDCFDNAHPDCFLREFYADMDIADTHVRVGRQIVVWGKTDAFRLQDIVNPLDLGFHNIFPDLDERYIPQWILDVTHSFGAVGPLDDVSLEFVWNFDKFIPTQLGQCGEPYAFTLSCDARADAIGHQLLNISLAGADKKAWKFTNTEPGLRLEFRLPDPAISFSLSAYYGFQDTPVARFKGNYSVAKPNPAIFMFFQGLGLGPVIQFLGASTGTTANCSTWTTGFDPYAVNPDGTPIAGSTLDNANRCLLAGWNRLTPFTVFGQTLISPRAAAVDPTLVGLPPGSDPGKAAAATGLQILDFAWGESETVLKYPRVLTFGGSADYQVPGLDAVLRAEVAYDIGRKFVDTSKADLVSESNVVKASLGFDRSAFIRFLNPDRTAFLSIQTFAEWITQYHGGTNGFINPQVSLISTALMQNYWRNDSIVLTNFVAYDWNARALIAGPKIHYVWNDHLSFDLGVNLLWGTTHHHNIRDLCPSGKLDCLTQDPSTWNPGQWQGINEAFKRSTQSPFGWLQEGFADHFMEKRDEVWIGATYQF
jgi:hypothetical protein